MSLVLENLLSFLVGVGLAESSSCAHFSAAFSSKPSSAKVAYFGEASSEPLQTCYACHNNVIKQKL